MAPRITSMKPSHATTRPLMPVGANRPVEPLVVVAVPVGVPVVVLVVVDPPLGTVDVEVDVVPVGGTEDVELVEDDGTDDVVVVVVDVVEVEVDVVEVDVVEVDVVEEVVLDAMVVVVVETVTPLGTGRVKVMKDWSVVLSVSSVETLIWQLV
jgi:hypothetical protein